MARAMRCSKIRNLLDFRAVHVVNGSTMTQAFYFGASRNAPRTPAAGRDEAGLRHRTRRALPEASRDTPALTFMDPQTGARRRGVPWAAVVLHSAEACAHLRPVPLRRVNEPVDLLRAEDVLVALMRFGCMYAREVLAAHFSIFVGWPWFLRPLRSQHPSQITKATFPKIHILFKVDRGLLSMHRSLSSGALV